MKLFCEHFGIGMPQIEKVNISPPTPMSKVKIKTPHSSLNKSSHPMMAMMAPMSDDEEEDEDLKKKDLASVNRKLDNNGGINGERDSDAQVTSTRCLPCRRNER